MPIMLALALLLLSSCIQAQPPPFSCNDYADPSLRLQCQSMVLGLYMQGTTQMYSRWNESMHIEPVYPATGAAPAPWVTPTPLTPVPPPGTPKSTFCQLQSGAFSCQ